MLELLVYPVIYQVWKWHWEMKKTAVRGSIQGNDWVPKAT
jgi:hypothetical protein